MISITQIKGARSMLGLSQARLAELAGLGVRTVVQLESGADSRSSTLRVVEAALLASGAIFDPAAGSVSTRLVAGPTSPLTGAETIAAADLIIAAANKARKRLP
jgi:DNA-binding XRE family transcriptional regulator